MKIHKTERLSIRVTKPLKQTIEQLAKNENRPISSMAEILLTMAITSELMEKAKEQLRASRKKESSK